tara:strand:- start:12442 stop:13521 length:1080 start_codon:yes stop_codon:yes gene_type:complete
MNSTYVRNARRFLTINNIPRDGLSDTEIVLAANEAGYPAYKDAVDGTAAVAITAAQAATATPDATQAALAQLIATLTPATKQFNEQELKAIIEKYSNPVSTLTVQHPTPAPAVSIKGAHKKLQSIVARLNAGYKVYLYGPAGSGKTTLAEQAATALNLDFYHTGALLQKYELTGFNDAQGNYVPTSFYSAYKLGGVYLFDELDASAPQAVIAFNQAVENGQMTFPHEVVKQHANFRVIAAANTNGNGGSAQYKRNSLDGASLDRFLRIALDYDVKLERRLAHEEHARLGGEATNKVDEWVDLVLEARRAAAKKKIDVIISPRSSKNGAGLLALGETLETALAETFGASLSKDQLAQLGL